MACVCVCVCIGNKEHFMLNSWHRLSEAARAKLATMHEKQQQQQQKAEEEVETGAEAEAETEAETEATRCVSYQLLSKVVPTPVAWQERERDTEREGEGRRQSQLNENSIELTFQLNSHVESEICRLTDSCASIRLRFLLLLYICYYENDLSAALVDADGPDRRRHHQPHSFGR